MIVAVTGIFHWAFEVTVKPLIVAKPLRLLCVVIELALLAGAIIMAIAKMMTDIPIIFLLNIGITIPFISYIIILWLIFY